MPVRTDRLSCKLVGTQTNQLNKHTSTKKHKHTDTQTHRHTDKRTHRHTDTPIHRHTDTPTHRHTDTQTHRHTDTQTHRHTDRENALDYLVLLLALPVESTLVVDEELVEVPLDVRGPHRVVVQL